MFRTNRRRNGKDSTQTDFYPALYYAADKTSNRAQSTYLWLIKAHSALLVLGAGLSVYGITSRTSAVVAAICFLLALGATLLLAFMRYESIWYRARAVAESIKTSAWRFAMRAHPYEGDAQDPEISRQFREVVANILTEHPQLTEHLAATLDAGPQATPALLQIRQRPREERLQDYLQQRVREQKDWYHRKAKKNRSWGNRWFFALVTAHIAAIILILFRIKEPSYEHWPVEVFIVLGGAIMTWLQVKRHRELASAYTLTALEIGLLEEDAERVDSEAALDQYMRDAENAFSREHTQWVARRDT